MNTISSVLVQGDVENREKIPEEKRKAEHHRDRGGEVGQDHRPAAQGAGDRTEITADINEIRTGFRMPLGQRGDAARRRTRKPRWR